LAKSFTLDGEAVVCGADGVAVFDALHRRGKVREAILQAFDLLELNGQDFRPLSLGERKKRLGPASPSTTTPTPRASWCSDRPVQWAWRASFRSA
jgi:ATP-dependent DNA ligase